MGKTCEAYFMDSGEPVKCDLQAGHSEPHHWEIDKFNPPAPETD